MPLSKKSKKYRLAILLIMISCLLAEAVSRLEWIEPLENAFYDQWHQMAGVRTDDLHTAIIAVDNESLLKFPNDPLAFWGPHFAQAIQTLRQAGARCIGIDFLFSVSAESWLNQLKLTESDLSRTYDIPFRSELNQGAVFLIATADFSDAKHPIIQLPVNDYLYALPEGPADVGFSNFPADSDSVIRHFVPRLFGDGRLPSLTFAFLLAKRAEKQKSVSAQSNPPLSESDAMQKIGFVGPPGTIPRVSFARLLEPGAASNPEIQALKDKIVILSAEQSASNDLHMSPYIRKTLFAQGQPMSGAELHANIVETLLTGRSPANAASVFRIAWMIAITATGAMLFLTLKPMQGLLGLTMLGMIHLGAAYLFFLHDRILPGASANLALSICYIGALGFRLSGEERKRARLQKILGPYVSDAVVEKILSTGNMPDLGGETLTVTVLFSDIRKFTTISEKLAPHEVVEMLNSYYALACEPIMAHGGMVDKFIGDAVMAVFGAPVSYPDHGRRAVAAALDMAQIAVDFQAWLKNRFSGRDLPDFNIGVGIHTGKAVIGNIGSAKRMGYTAIGDTVNIASRLESMTKQLGWKIIASRETVSEIGDEVLTGKSAWVTPAGRTDPIEALEILRFYERGQ